MRRQTSDDRPRVAAPTSGRERIDASAGNIASETEIRMKRLCIGKYVKDPFPGLSHWFGFGLAIAALVVLMVLSRGRTLHVVGFAIYGTCLIFLYLASALAHSVHCSPAAEERLNRLDYTAIFLAIAGSYTPICLIALGGTLGWSLLAAVWTIAALGIASVYAFPASKKWPRVAAYLGMSWLAIIAGGHVYAALSPAALGWLLAGGAIYSLGAIVFATDRPHLWPGRFVAHDLWHVMVLAGSACHFAMMVAFAA